MDTSANTPAVRNAMCCHSFSRPTVMSTADSTSVIASGAENASQGPRFTENPFAETTVFWFLTDD